VAEDHYAALQYESFRGGIGEGCRIGKEGSAQCLIMED
jgi:hypothetical protein